MPKVTLDISPDMLRWAYQRAGYDKENAEAAFPKLASWLVEETKPTMRDLEKFAKRFYVPVGYLFLSKAPNETIPFPVFRGTANLADNFDLNLYDTVMSISSRQEWLEEYLQRNDIETTRLVGVISLQDPVGESVQRLRSILGLDETWTFSLSSSSSAVSRLTDSIEDSGVFVAFNGVVGNNTRRAIKVDTCRGFALVNPVAPYIFVNSADSKTAQLFTLIHEVAHIMLGVSAGHAGDDDMLKTDVATEAYCDKVAAEFLVPTNELKKLWRGNIAQLSRQFKVSEIVIARRARELGLMTATEYSNFWKEYSGRPRATQKANSGGDFYKTSVKRVGRIFAIHVRNAVNARQLNYTEAYRLTGLYGDTYQRFMTNNI